MSHNCGGQPRTAGELVKALSAVDPSLPVRESWDETAGWFDVCNDVVWLGVHGPCDHEHVPEEDKLTLERVEQDIAKAPVERDVPEPGTLRHLIALSLMYSLPDVLAVDIRNAVTNLADVLKRNGIDPDALLT